MRNISKLLPASKLKLVISSIGVLALVVFSGLVLFELTKAEVVITDNDERQTVTTHTDTVGELLAEVGITVGEHDDLSHDLDAQIENGMEIQYDTAKEVVVTIDGDKQVFHTTTDTIEEFLSEENLSFAARDDISHDKTEAIKNGLHIEVATAYEVTINDGGKEKKVWTTGSTVGELLDSNQIKFNKKLDKVKPAIDEEVTEDTSITIVHVEKATEEVTEKIAFNTEKKNDSSLLKGEEQVVTQGQEGTVVKKYEVIFENKKEVSRELVSEEVKEDSKNRVIAIGTKEPVQKKETNLVTLSSKKSQSTNTTKKSSSSNSSQTSSESKSSSEVFTMSASAFTASCNGCSGFTATGINLGANPNMKVIAVDPSVIPLGSKVWVEGYGEAIAGDTGGHIKGNRIDVHVPTKEDAYNWGRRTVTVKVLN